MTEEPHQRCPNCKRVRCVVFIDEKRCRCNGCGYEFEPRYTKPV